MQYSTEAVSRVPCLKMRASLITLLFVALAAVSPDAVAMPVAPKVAKLQQKNGATFHARPFGDEWDHGYETLAGYTVVQSPDTGDWVFATTQPDGTLEPTGLRPEKDNPGQLKKHARDKRGADAREANDSRFFSSPGAETNATASATDSASQAAISGNTGSHRTLVILAKFDNQGPVGTTAAHWVNQFFGATNSVRHYFREVSYNQLSLDPAAESEGTANDGVVGWVRVGATHPNYGFGSSTAMQQLTRDAILAANPYVNFSAFDTNGDNKISTTELHVVVIVAGYEQSYGGTAQSPTPNVWGHQYSCGTYAPICDGKKVADSTVGGYTQFGEWMKANDDPPPNTGFASTLGIMVHEMGHDLKWPDLYDTDGSSNGVGEWSVMGQGGWLSTPGQNLGTMPCHPDPFCKSYQGWIAPQQVSGSLLGVQLPQVETSGLVYQLLANPGGVNWVFGSFSGTGEYFLVENRQKVGYDAGLNGCGILVWHIDETRTATNSCNATDSRRLVDLEEADGFGHIDTLANRGDSGDSFPGLNNKQLFSAATTPNSNLYSGAASGVMLRNFSACAPTMTADIIVGGPYFAGGSLALAAESCSPPNAAIDPDEAVTMNISLQNAGTGSTSNLVATLLPTGGVSAPSAAQAYGAIPAGGVVARPFTFTATGNCGEPLMLSLKLQDGATNLGTVGIPVTMGAAGTAQTFMYSGLNVAIPDGGAVQVAFEMAGVAGVVGDINLKIGGSSCNTMPGSTTVGIDHGWVGDLQLTLISPSGTRVVLMSQIGKYYTTNGVNMCNTNFDDEGSQYIQIVDDTNAPFTGNYIPKELLAKLDGEPVNGTWLLELADLEAGYAGTLREFSFTVTPRVCCGSGSTFTTISDDGLDTNETQAAGAGSGWSINGQTDPSIVNHDYDAANGAYRIHVASHPNRFRQTGWISNREEWLPYSAIGPDKYVRAKFHVYTGGQADPSQLKTIPNFRLKLANRFAVTADLQVLLHDANDPGNQPYAMELRPSTNPSNPSVYRLDFDPVDVPFLQTNTLANEGIMAGFDIFTIEPQDNGFIALTELEMGVYPASVLASANALQTKIYAPTAGDAGGLKLHTATDLRSFNYVILPGPEGSPAGVETVGNLPTHSEGPAGVTIDSRYVAADRIGFLDRSFFAGNADGSPGYMQRIRASEDRIFKVRWHVTSPQSTTNQAWLWLQQRTIKFGWTQSLQLAGGRSSNNANSQALSRQTVPGVGSQNPDKLVPGENGGWYTALFNSPMSAEIRPELPYGTPLSHRMPRITSLAGPGVQAPSNGDVKLSAKLYDTISQGTGKGLEGGLFTIDRIEIQAFDSLDD